MVCSRRIMRILLGLFLVPLWLGAQQVAVKEHQLSNGMKVLLLERNDAPSISGGWVARVGSVDERPGITGMAHLFEHGKAADFLDHLLVAAFGAHGRSLGL